MIKSLIRNLFDKAGVQFTLKKNLWYIDAYEVQRRIITGKSPVIFDVGANEGSVVRQYKSIYPDASIHAFEPQPDSFAVLSKLAAGLKGVSCSNIALSDTEGTGRFYKTRSNAASSLLPSIPSETFVDEHTRLAETFDVGLDTLDHYTKSCNIEAIDILKMDVQGNELNILKGGHELLQEGRIKIIYSEVWFIKAYDKQPFYEDIALYLRDFGYTSFGLYNMHWDLKRNGKNLWADAIFLKNL